MVNLLIFGIILISILLRGFFLKYDEPISIKKTFKMLGFYFFIIVNEYSAIGFILAAKGFARIKEMENREFADYVLIGTLLSTAISIFIGLIFKKILLFY